MIDFYRKQIRDRVARFDAFLRYIGNPRIKGRFRILFYAGKLALLARLRPQSTEPVKVLHYRLSYGSLAHLATLFRDIFINRPYAAQFSKPDPLIIDAGANIGLTALFYKFYYPGAKIICFEPDPDTFALLQKNVTDNVLSDVLLHHVALSDHEGSVVFYREAGSKGGDPGASVKPEIYERSRQDWGSNASNEQAAQVKVPAAKLSTYLTRPVDMLKIDIEGSEGVVMDDIVEKLDQITEVAMEFHVISGANELGPMLSLFEKSGHRYRLIPLSGEVANQNGSLAFIYTHYVPSV